MRKMSAQTSRRLLLIVSLILVAVIGCQILYSAGIVGNKEKGEEFPSAVGDLSKDGYTLTRTVILSRHSIRSPLSGNGSTLGTITPHEWFSWSSAPSELSLKGTVLETEMGEYFRKWMEKEGLIPENYIPGEGEVRIYSNSKQRTIATARCFASGLFPVGDVTVEHHGEYDTMDPVFNPVLTFMTDEYAQDIKKEIFDLYGEEFGLLGENFALLDKVLDTEKSEAFAGGSFSGFTTDDIDFSFENGSEPRTTGSLKTGCQAADALVLQLYEEKDPEAAAFGEKLSFTDWQKISYIKDLYVDALFSTPLVSVNVANPLLKELYLEMTAEGRKISFLCGHDSSLASVTAALGVAEYTLPSSVEQKTPIGSKLVFCRWENSSGEAFWSIDIVYQTTQQLRDMPILTPEAGPAVYPLILEGVMMNEDGMYREDALFERFMEAIDAYDELMEKYAPESGSEDAA